MTAVKIEIEPKQSQIGPGGRQMYRVEYEGEELIAGTREPLFASCRILLERGITGRLEMWAKGETAPRMFCDIETGAKRAVMENDKHGPRIVKWAPNPRWQAA